mmetsp:Transcript_16074/g.27137  ORF Transcript_16074/g.27137 Transcript_16074/m.27137 type:complete len:131 (-) Transcript_16074:472-864(-)
MRKIRSGEIVVPNYQETCVSPNLFAYYETLPSWARENPFIKNCVVAFEHTKPWVKIRDKEQMLNFACSILRPMDSIMEGVMTEAITSNKIMLNAKLGDEMLNELPFYELDKDWLGSESEEEFHKKVDTED